jgi:hypothetical protein
MRCAFCKGGNIMQRYTLKKIAALIMAVIISLSSFSSFGMIAFAAGTEGKSLTISFPREGDGNYDGTWGHKKVTFMNGWNLGEINYTNIYTIDSYSGKICYCIEPGTTLRDGDTFTKRDETFWDDYSSEYNDTIKPATIKLLVSRIMQYGYTGNVSLGWRSQNSSDADKLSHAFATQILIWETIVGERDENFNHVSAGSHNAILDILSKNHPLRTRIMNYYNSIVSSVKGHSILPSFCAKSSSKAQTIELEWNGFEYVATLTDSNKVIEDYNFSSDDSNLKFSKSGNKLTITSTVAPTDTVALKATRSNYKRMGLILWSDGKFAPGKGQQDLVSYTQSVTDSSAGYLKIEVSYGSAKIVKTSEDGKVSGISFTISGNGVNKTVTTNSKGEIEIDNLQPGTYTVTEITDDKYETQKSQKVTVISGQTATVNFNNILRRGNLIVTKTAEDNLEEGMRFRLYGTSYSGLPVDECAMVGDDGKAYFEDVLIGTDYTLEEVDTPIRYVIPEKQKAQIEWNKVTQKSVDNNLKKWNLTVTKRDSANGTAQGDGSLAGAVYGIYKGEELIDEYTTDAKGKFTTKYYVCGNDWSLREITPSEGYLIDTTSHHIGAEAEDYTEEYNNLSTTVKERIKEGKIAIIKHSDNGDTQIETPEEGAEFEIFLKSSGSYNKANESERDVIVCDENGFAQSKELPYGIYTVKQTKGWDGRELMKPFDVYIEQDDQIYRYIINNSNFESYLKIIKIDEESGKSIPLAGTGFKIYDPSGKLIKMKYTYPKVTTIDTFYTNNEGYLITPERLPYGEGYSIVEVQAPYGYVLNSEPIYFDITEKDSSEEESVTVVSVKCSNVPQKGKITVGKSGEVFSSVVKSGDVYQPVYEIKGLQDAVFKIIAAEDIYTPDGTFQYSKGTVIDKITTTKEGVATSKTLYLGKYKIKEIQAPHGMVLDTEEKAVEITYAGQNVKITETSMDFYDERQKVKIDLKKTMEQDELFNIGQNKEILSVQFGLFADEDLTASDGKVIPKDGLIEIINCNKKGKAKFITDLPIDTKLYVKEIATDNHYITSDTKYPAVFDYAGQDIATVNIAINEGENIINKMMYGSVKGLKVDRETEESIVGAVFGLFHSNETDLKEETAILITESNEEGVFIFENIPYGDWVIKELAPAEGFLPNEEIYQVSIGTNEEVIDITIVNDRIPEIKTTATVKGKKEVTAKGTITLEDSISYKHLIPGKEYIVKGILMDKATGKPLLIDGKKIRAKTTFIPNDSSGEVTVSFTFDSKIIKEKTDIVVFESLYSDGIELVVHADIKDKGQTVRLVPPIPRVPQTSDESNFGFWIGLLGISLGGLISVVIIYLKKKKDDGE